jgi:hypothetical protein
MELKAIYFYGGTTYYFQCKKCGEVISIGESRGEEEE